MYSHRSCQAGSSSSADRPLSPAGFPDPGQHRPSFEPPWCSSPALEAAKKNPGCARAAAGYLGGGMTATWYSSCASHGAPPSADRETRQSSLAPTRSLRSGAPPIRRAPHAPSLVRSSRSRTSSPAAPPVCGLLAPSGLRWPPAPPLVALCARSPMEFTIPHEVRRGKATDLRGKVTDQRGKVAELCPSRSSKMLNRARALHLLQPSSVPRGAPEAHVAKSGNFA